MTSLVFDVGTAAAGEPVNLDPLAATNRVVIAYRDSTINVSDVGWTTSWLVGDGDDLLENGELVEITVDTDPITSGVTLAANQSFVLEVRPPLGGTMVIARTTPVGLDTIVDLH